MYRILQPQPVALLVQLRHAEAGVFDRKPTEAAGEKKILIMVSALG
jgi:hypothetical protein